MLLPLHYNMTCAFFKESAVLLLLSFVCDSEQERCNWDGWKHGKTNRHDAHMLPILILLDSCLLVTVVSEKGGNMEKNSSIRDIIHQPQVKIHMKLIVKVAYAYNSQTFPSCWLQILGKAVK